MLILYRNLNAINLKKTKKKKRFPQDTIRKSVTAHKLLKNIRRLADTVDLLCIVYNKCTFMYGMKFDSRQKFDSVNVSTIDVS